MIHLAFLMQLNVVLQNVSNNVNSFTDIDECVEGANCKPNQRCVNTHGGYICTNVLSCEGGLKLSDDKTRCIGKMPTFLISVTNNNK